MSTEIIYYEDTEEEEKKNNFAYLVTSDNL